MPENTKHSSYTYQKLFRAIYGYTQNVTKSNGKTYHYHRKGILSETPYIRPGKNCVIIPPKSFTALDSFFKTGKNPTHFWRIKGNWKAVYYLDEKNLDETQAIQAIKEQIDRAFQPSFGGIPIPDIVAVAEKSRAGVDPNQEKTRLALVEADKIVNSPWFKDVYPKDRGLKRFYEAYRSLKP